MAHYTPEFLARLRAQYEDGDLPVDEVAAEFHISTRTLGRLALRENWDRRSASVRDVPRAMRLLEEVQALTVSTLPPQSGGEGRRAPQGASRGGPAQDEFKEPPPPGPSPPRAARGGGGGLEATPTPTLPLAGGGSAPAIDRLERLVLDEIEGEEARRAQRGERSPAATERGARTLAILTQALRNLQRLRAGDLTDTATPNRDSSHDDDMPHDIDEFRRDLARRIAAFMESRPDDGDADESGDTARLDEVR